MSELTNTTRRDTQIALTSLDMFDFEGVSVASLGSYVRFSIGGTAFPFQVWILPLSIRQRVILPQWLEHHIMGRGTGTAPVLIIILPPHNVI